jgi:hypothetical protein
MTSGAALFFTKNTLWERTAKKVKRVYSTSPVMGDTNLFAVTKQRPETNLGRCVNSGSGFRVSAINACHDDRRHGCWRW